MSNTNKHASGASGGARRATEEAPEAAARAGGGRWSARRKVAVILELLRGADLESISRKHRVTVATLTQWRERFLAGGELSLKSRSREVEDEQMRRLKSVVAGVSVENELLREMPSLRIMAFKVVRGNLPADRHVPDVPAGGAASSSARYSAATALGEINF